MALEEGGNIGSQAMPFRGWVPKRELDKKGRQLQTSISFLYMLV